MAKKTNTLVRKPRARRKPQERKVDPVVTEIVRNGVIAVTEEMKTNLMRTAYNIIIYEALDFTTGLFTPQGETISIGIGLPMFIRGMAETVKAKIKHFGADNIHPGDIYVTNDSYLTGSHLNHVTLTLPIFHKRKLVGVLLLHGALARYRRHARRHDHRHLFGRPADSDPQISGPRRGQPDRGRHHPAERAPAEPRHGRSARAGHRGEDRRAALPRADRPLRPRRRCSMPIGAIMDHAEAMARARTRTIPDGVYEAESYMDDDGIEVGKPVPIRVRVVVKGDEMTVDLSEVSKQVRGFYNSGITTGYACAQVAYKCLTSPTDYPINDGSFRSLKTDRAAGPRHQRGAAGADALVDDLSDDHRRHHLQGAGAGHPGSRHRRPPRRSAGLARSTASTPGRRSSSSAASGRSAAAGAPR